MPRVTLHLLHQGDTGPWNPHWGHMAIYPHLIMSPLMPCGAQATCTPNKPLNTPNNPLNMAFPPLPDPTTCMELDLGMISHKKLLNNNFWSQA